MPEVQFDNEEIFFEGPLLLDHVRVEMVMPALTALLANAPWQSNGNLGPVLGSVLRHKLRQEVVFLFGPAGADHVVTIGELEKPFVTLNFRFSQYFADTVPGLITVLLHVLKKEFVLRHVEMVRLGC